MAVTLVGPGSTTGNTALVSSRAVAVPNNGGANPLQANDIVVVRLSRWDASINPAVTAPSGFVHLTQVTQAGGTKIDTYLKRLTAADTGTYTFSWTGAMWSTATARAYRGVDTATTLTAVPLHQVTNTGTSWPAATLSGVAAGVLDWHGYSESNGNPHSVPTTPAFTKLTDDDSDVGAYFVASAGSYTTSGGSAVANSNNTVSMLHLPAASSGNNTAVTPAVETDTGVAAGHARGTSVTPAPETDAGVAAGRTESMPAGPAGETDTGQAVARTRASGTAPATETDTGVAAARTRAQIAGPAAETDVAQTVGHPGGTPVTPATETDTGVVAGRTRQTPLAPAAEADTGVAVDRTRASSTTPATETDQALPVPRTQAVPVSPAQETDTAVTAAHSRGTPVQPAQETDEAVAAGDPNAIIRDLDVAVVVEPARFTVILEPARFDAQVEPGRFRTEIDA